MKLRNLFFVFAALMAGGGLANAQTEEVTVVEVEEPVEAPNFTLKDLDGKDVSLSDYRGKWVILDFWGSWCPWCIKGFPELKEAYAKYGDELVVIGIDCRESEEKWREGVKEYELPWVNVYNPENSNLTNEYNIQGYPTKFIIDPDGFIANMTIGHDPSFFVALESLLGR